MLLLTACDQQAVSVYKLSGSTMGTQYHITVTHAEQFDSASVQGQVDQLLEAVENSMSTYRPDSELSRLNRAPDDEWLPISAGLHDLLLLSMELSWLSGGAFDITVGPLVDLWGFGPQFTNDQIPSQAQIDALLPQVGFQNLELSLQQSEVMKHSGAHIDLSAIAKGWAVDRVAELLQGLGYSNYLVEIGGEIQVKGLNPKGQPWRLAIESPQTLVGGVFKAVELSQGGIATSGDYRNYFMHEGQRYSHTIDPRTGQPVVHDLASVTVIDESTGRADGLATALSVLGPERGLQLAEQFGLAVYMIVREGDELVARHSSAFEPYLLQ